MRKVWGGLMASSAATAVIAGRVTRFDGAADLLEDGTGTGTGTGTGDGTGDGTGTGTGTGDGTGDGTGTGTGTGTGGEVADWMKTFSGDKAGEDPSHQEWLASKGFKDPDALIASYRNAEKQIRESGKVKVPGADAKPEEIAAFREAMGIPKDVEGYTVEMPAGAEQFEIDTAILGPLKEAALEHNVTPAAFKALADKFLEAAVEDAKAEVTRTDTEAADKLKEWGAKAPQNKEDFRRGGAIPRALQGRRRRHSTRVRRRQNNGSAGENRRLAGRGFLCGRRQSGAAVRRRQPRASREEPR
jgi:hypothetical protein